MEFRYCRNTCSLADTYHMRVILFNFSIILCFIACSQSPTSRPVNEAAVKLNNQTIPLLTYVDNKDSCLKALQLLDVALSLDSNCVSCYVNKLVFLNRLKDWQKVTDTYSQLIRIQPVKVDWYMGRGANLYRAGDTALATKDFERCLSLTGQHLDTMSRKSRLFDQTRFNRALCFIVLNHPVEGNELLNKICEERPDDALKSFFCSYKGKRKHDILYSQ